MTRSVTRASRWLLVAVAVVLAVLLTRAWLWRPATLAGSVPHDGFVRVAGVVHAHTTASDGSGTPEDVLAAARQAGAAFAIITDHNAVDPNALDGYRDGVLVVGGAEFSTTAGHVLGIGIATPRYRLSGDALDDLDDISALGGLAFAAHPLSARDDLRFTGWQLPGGWGIELMNGDSEWRGAGARLWLTLATYVANRRYALLQLLNSPAATLARWDALLATRDVTGIGGTDAHGQYATLFALMQNHLLLKQPLTGRAADDRKAVLDAFRHGHLYVGVDGFANANDFFFTARSGGAIATMGDTVEPTGTVRLEAGGRLPSNASVVLVRDGRPIAEQRGGLAIDAPGDGVYRVEVHVAGLRPPWILSNPIYLFDAAARARRSEHAVVERPALPTETIPLDKVGPPIVLAAAADSLSSASADVTPPQDEPGGAQATRLRFALGTPTSGQPNVYAALVDRAHRDLSGHTGLALSIRADGVYRVWVQLRDQNAATDDGTEWWAASVRTSPEWQTIAVPFSRFRSTISAHSDGALDLNRVVALLFVLDRGAISPGTHGTIWVRGVSVY